MRIVCRPFRLGYRARGILSCEYEMSALPLCFHDEQSLFLRMSRLIRSTSSSEPTIVKATRRCGAHGCCPHPKTNGDNAECDWYHRLFNPCGNKEGHAAYNKQCTQYAHAPQHDSNECLPSSHCAAPFAKNHFTPASFQWPLCRNRLNKLNYGFWPTAAGSRVPNLRRLVSTPSRPWRASAIRHPNHAVTLSRGKYQLYGGFGMKQSSWNRSPQEEQLPRQRKPLAR